MYTVTQIETAVLTMLCRRCLVEKGQERQPWSVAGTMQCINHSALGKNDIIPIVCRWKGHGSQATTVWVYLDPLTGKEVEVDPETLWQRHQDIVDRHYIGQTPAEQIQLDIMRRKTVGIELARMFTD